MKSFLIKVLIIVFLPLFIVSAGEVNKKLTPIIDLPIIELPIIITPIIEIPEIPIYKPVIPILPIKTYTIENLTSSLTKSSAFPSIYGNNITWVTEGTSSGKSNIYYLDKGGMFSPAPTPKKITSSEAVRYLNSIYEKTIVWEEEVGSYMQLFYYNGSTISQMTSGSYHSMYPSLYNGSVAYSSSENGVYNIYLRDGLSIKQLTNSTSKSSAFPSLSDGKVAWESNDGHDHEIYYWNGTKTVQITNNEYNDFEPSLHNGKIAWYAYDGNDYEIYYWNGSTITQITNNEYNDYSPSLYNGKIVWRGYDGNDFEIYYWDGTNISKITSNSVTDSAPKLYNGAIVWGGYESSSSTKSDIFYTVVDTPTIPVPAAQDVFYYSAVKTPVKEMTASLSKPFATGDMTTGKLSLKVSLPNFSGPVDVYIGIGIPSLHPDVHILKSDSLTLVPVSSGLDKWKSNITSTITESLFGSILLSTLPDMELTLYVLVTPVGNLDKYYLWYSTFNITH